MINSDSESIISEVILSELRATRKEGQETRKEVQEIKLQNVETLVIIKSLQENQEGITESVDVLKDDYNKRKIIKRLIISLCSIFAVIYGLIITTIKS